MMILLVFTWSILFQIVLTQDCSRNEQASVCQSYFEPTKQFYMVIGNNIETGCHCEVTLNSNDTSSLHSVTITSAITSMADCGYSVSSPKVDSGAFNCSESISNSLRSGDMIMLTITGTKDPTSTSRLCISAEALGTSIIMQCFPLTTTTTTTLPTTRRTTSSSVTTSLSSTTNLASERVSAWPGTNSTKTIESETTPIVIAPASQDGESTVDIPLILNVCVGVLIIITVIFILIYCLRRRRKQMRDKNAAPSEISDSCTTGSQLGRLVMINQSLCVRLPNPSKGRTGIPNPAFYDAHSPQILPVHKLSAQRYLEVESDNISLQNEVGYYGANSSGRQTQIRTIDFDEEEV